MEDLLHEARLYSCACTHFYNIWKKLSRDQKKKLIDMCQDGELYGGDNSICLDVENIEWENMGGSFVGVANGKIVSRTLDEVEGKIPRPIVSR